MVMKEKKTCTSAHFPYIPVTVVLNKRIETIEALLDSGFDGDLIIPEGLMTNGKPPDAICGLPSPIKSQASLPPRTSAR